MSISSASLARPVPASPEVAPYLTDPAIRQDLPRARVVERGARSQAKAVLRLVGSALVAGTVMTLFASVFLLGVRLGTRLGNQPSVDSCALVAVMVVGLIAVITETKYRESLGCERMAQRRHDDDPGVEP